jgi:hypothetical protein
VIYAIIGRLLEADYADSPVIAWWPIAYRVDETDAKNLITALETERDTLARKLEPILEKLRSHKPHRKRAMQHPRDGQVWKARLDELNAKVAATLAAHTENSIDPLFPTLTDTPVVRYSYVVFYDDPRELPMIEIIKKRAQLWGAIVDDYQGDDD